MNEQGSNPYAPPVAIVNDEVLQLEEGNYIPGGQCVEVGRAVSWLGSGWAFFTQTPGMWILLSIVMVVVMFVVMMTFGALQMAVVSGFSVIGMILSNLVNIFLWQGMSAGVMVACDNQRQNGRLDIADLFVGFQRNFPQLVVLSLLTFGLWIVCMIPFVLILGGSFLTAMMGGIQPDPALFGSLAGGVILAVIITFGLGICFLAATWFAPALIVLQQRPPIEAMFASFTGCMKNWLAGLIYFILTFVLMILGLIPLLLGLLVVLPMLMASSYAAYRDIYIEE